MERSNIFGKSVFSVSLNISQTAQTVTRSSNAAYIPLGEISFCILVMSQLIVT